jgi:hypothetical protein
MVAATTMMHTTGMMPAALTMTTFLSASHFLLSLLFVRESSFAECDGNGLLLWIAFVSQPANVGLDGGPAATFTKHGITLQPNSHRCNSANRRF